MGLQLCSRFLLRQGQVFKGLNLPKHFPSARSFHGSARARVVKPFLLADIGEGIRECEIIQWFIEPEARVEEFDKICEVQSDKASVDITSKYTGVIKKLYYEAGEMAQVGKPLVDIEIQGVKEEELAADPNIVTKEPKAEERAPVKAANQGDGQVEPVQRSQPSSIAEKAPKGKHSALATPAVRHLTKELDVRIEDVDGSGRDGRVLKDDVYQFAKQRDSTSSTSPTASSGPQKETPTKLSNTQYKMFKTMTNSLAIPHFLYADEIDFTNISALRARLNKGLAKSPVNDISKISYMPFVIKAVSMSLQRYPILNARVDVDPESGKPILIMRNQHNIGVAIDTPAGLMVPVIKNVSSLDLMSIAIELKRLQSLAAAGKLSSKDLSGGTITVSNIGNIGGTYLSPVIVDKEVAILGMGKMKTIPAFNENGDVVKKQVCNFSWSADHRVVDGATMARAAEVVKGFVEDPDSMVMHLR